MPRAIKSAGGVSLICKPVTHCLDILAARTKARLVLIESEPGFRFLFDAFSSRKPGSTSIENAIAI
jgi:hypothetical protein